MSVFNERLKECRNKNNLMQKQISEFLNITTRNYQRYEAGVLEPNIDKLIALSNYFDVSLDYLVGRTDNPAINK